MPHIALARKYRPRRFGDVASQSHVAETLRRAVATGRVGHAYLFCGPRGVGKTTLARVLAMALNCPHRSEDGEPCGVCESCTRIWGGQTALDVVEIDAASNRGVDDARDLRERAMYAPSEEGRHKVYIVDEAHMLTREAWNALLKILEEPPSRVIFAFATTEPQKIQQTAAPILSRCQRFDFRRIGTSDIVARLEGVLSSENVSAPPEALQTIARRADGGMRDALSLLDQVLALTGGEISLEATRQVLGLVEEDRYAELLDILTSDRQVEVFRFVQELLDEGYDLSEFYLGWVDTLRLLLRLCFGEDRTDDGVSPESLRRFGRIASRFEPEDLVRMLALSMELEGGGDLRRSPNPRMLIEMLLLRLSYLDRTVRLEELLQRLGGAPAGDGTMGRSGSGRPKGGKAPTQGAGEAAVEDPVVVPEEEGTELLRGPPDGISEGTSADDSVVEEILAEAAPQGSTLGATSGPVADSMTDVPQESVDLPDSWKRFLESGKGLPSGLAPFLKAAVISVTHDVPSNQDAAQEDMPKNEAVELALPPGPGLERLQEVVVRRQVADAFGSFLSRSVELTVVPLSGPEGQVEGRITQESIREGRLRDLLAQEPLLGEAVQELDLELLD